MLPDPELRRALADIKTVPLHGPFNRFVSFDAVIPPQSGQFRRIKTPPSEIQALGIEPYKQVDPSLTMDPQSDNRERSEHRELDDVFGLSYQALRRLAAGLQREAGGEAMDVDALVHMAWIKLRDFPYLASKGADFQAIAARAIQQVLVDEARQRLAQKSGGSPAKGFFPESTKAKTSAFSNLVQSARPLWGIGSIKNGGRYNKPETFEVIYLAEDPVTAVAEVNLIFSNMSTVGKIKGAPMVHIAVDGILENILNVTSSKVQQALATSHQELTGAWLWEQSRTGEAPTQRLGRIAFESERICALRYPSSKNPGGACVAVFPERLTGNSYVEVYDPFDNLAQRIPPVPPKPR
jgi:RES domain-containing protein